MTDPERLLGAGSDVERSVLGAWSSRQPDEGAKLRTLAALGVVGTTAGAATAAASLGSLAPKAVVASSAFLKWIAIGAGISATLGLVGYAAYVRGSSSPEVVAPAVPRPAPPPSAMSAEKAEARPTAQREPDDDLSVETLPPAPVRPAAPRSAAVTPPVAGSNLDEEVYAIDQARRALYGGSPARALELIDGFDAKYPGGALSQESAEIRIEALFRTGKRPVATKLATRFLASHPESPYAREIRALMATPSSNP